MIRAVVAIVCIAACAPEPIPPLSHAVPRTPAMTPRERAVAQILALLHAPSLDAATAEAILGTEAVGAPTHPFAGETRFDFAPTELFERISFGVDPRVNCNLALTPLPAVGLTLQDLMPRLLDARFDLGVVDEGVAVHGFALGHRDLALEARLEPHEPSSADASIDQIRNRARRDPIVVMYMSCRSYISPRRVTLRAFLAGV